LTISNVYTADFCFNGRESRRTQKKSTGLWEITKVLRTRDTAQTLGRKLKVGSEARTLYVLGRVLASNGWAGLVSPWGKRVHSAGAGEESKWRVTTEATNQCTRLRMANGESTRLILSLGGVAGRAEGGGSKREEGGGVVRQKVGRHLQRRKRPRWRGWMSGEEWVNL
jgi:hypothetical protein